MSEPITYVLPFPPSVNNLFAGKRRRYPTKRYKAWQASAGWVIAASKRRRCTSPVTIEIALSAPDKRRRDASNYIKGIEDLLVTMGVLNGDDSRHVRQVTSFWSEAVGPPGAVVTIKPAG